MGGSDMLPGDSPKSKRRRRCSGRVWWPKIAELPLTGDGSKPSSSGPRDGGGEDEFRNDLLAEDEIATIEVARPLGEGGAGESRSLIRFRGEIDDGHEDSQDQVHDQDSPEGNCSSQDTGLGLEGAPLFHGLCLRPSRMVVSFSGRPYDADVMRCSPRQVLDSLVGVGLKIHDRGVVHNFTVSTHGSVDLHVIDFGLSEYEGDILCSTTDPEEQFWIAPEVLERRPVRPAGDVFSFGHFIQDITTFVENEEVKQELEPLFVRANDSGPSARPTLPTLVDEFRAIA